MAAVIRNIVRGYKYVNTEIADPRTQDFFFIGSPWTLAILTGLFMHFVFNIGPRYMKERQPFKLDRILQLYNIFQILLCTFTFYKALDLAWLRDYSFFCEPVDYSYSPRSLEITRTVWLYFVTKILDLLDTIFFVLRKKQSQVTFLHVYHHVGMIFGGWCAVKYFAGGHATFLGLINSFVHMVMYTYYLLSSMKINTRLWKKYITQLQLLQFFLIMIHYAQLFWVEDCGFPVWTAAIMVPQNLFMMLLFGDFYYKTYIKKKPAQKATRTKIEINGISTEMLNGKSKGQ